MDCGANEKGGSMDACMPRKEKRERLVCGIREVERKGKERKGKEKESDYIELHIHNGTECYDYLKP